MFIQRNVDFILKQAVAIEEFKFLAWLIRFITAPYTKTQNTGEDVGLRNVRILQG